MDDISLDDFVAHLKREKFQDDADGFRAWYLAQQQILGHISYPDMQTELEWTSRFVGWLDAVD